MGSNALADLTNLPCMGSPGQTTERESASPLLKRRRVLTSGSVQAGSCLLPSAHYCSKCGAGLAGASLADRVLHIRSCQSRRPQCSHEQQEPAPLVHAQRARQCLGGQGCMVLQQSPASESHSSACTHAAEDSQTLMASASETSVQSEALHASQKNAHSLPRGCSAAKQRGLPSSSEPGKASAFSKLMAQHRGVHTYTPAMESELLDQLFPAHQATKELNPGQQRAQSHCLQCVGKTSLVNGKLTVFEDSFWRHTALQCPKPLPSEGLLQQRVALLKAARLQRDASSGKSLKA